MIETIITEENISDIKSKLINGEYYWCKYKEETIFKPVQVYFIELLDMYSIILSPIQQPKVTQPKEYKIEVGARVRLVNNPDSIYKMKVGNIGEVKEMFSDSCRVAGYGIWFFNDIEVVK